ncbi:DNA-binding protein [Stenotrophomonas sp. NPDC077659]|uniref:DNA-binding protein n=1 Tax=Stenotrophomonas sp. NPDC077659 TaxID=3390694 RepID=UPI003D03939C
MGEYPRQKRRVSSGTWATCPRQSDPATARGLTDLDVHDAADDIVSQGERPTVERIRAHLGTGSPNSVTRHLDSWWGSVGARLRQRAREQERPDVPGAVSALAQRCWNAALEAAAEHARAAGAAEQAVLDAHRDQLAAERADRDQERARQNLQLAVAEATPQQRHCWCSSPALPPCTCR